MLTSLLPVLLFVAVAAGLVVSLLLLANLFNPRRTSPVKQMPYESGMNPVHDTRRRFGIQFHLLAIAFLVFDVELLFLYPWAVVLHPASATTPAVSAVSAAPGLSVASTPDVPPAAPNRPARASHSLFLGGLVFLVLLALGFLYDWRKGIFQWR